MTGAVTNSENSESGGSRQVSPQQHLYDGNENEEIRDGSPKADGAVTENNGMFSVSSADSILKSAHHPNGHHRSRSASDISKLSGPVVDSNSPKPSVPSDEKDASEKPQPHFGLDLASSHDTLQGHIEPNVNGSATYGGKRNGLGYSASIPLPGAKPRMTRRSTAYYPGTTISALPLSIHKKQSSKLRRRLIFKNGDSNISATNVHKMSQRYLADIFTTLVDMQWRWTILLFGSSFFVSWVFYAAIWWLIAYLHDDLVEDTPHGNFMKGSKPCAQFVYSFPTALLFSIELQSTIGFGFRHTTDECPHAVGLMMIQSVFSVLLQSFMAGIVFAKLSRPLKRAETLMFSKHAVICERDGSLCLLIRIGDMRKSHILEGNIRALLVKKRVTREGEVLPLFQHNVELQMECGDQQLYLFWPLIACHVIDENSPLYNISFKSLRDERFELILILEGIVESTGMSTQAKTSYLPSEIKWGHRFTPLITYQKEDGTYQIDYRLFDETIDVETPMCSARELAEKRGKGLPVPMIKPFGFNSNDCLHPSMPYYGRDSVAPSNGTSGMHTPVMGTPSVFVTHPSEMWPAGPRSSVFPQIPKRPSLFGWIRKRKRSLNESDAADGGEMVSLVPPGRAPNIEQGASGNPRLAHQV